MSNEKTPALKILIESISKGEIIDVYKIQSELVSNAMPLSDYMSIDATSSLEKAQSLLNEYGPKFEAKEFITEPITGFGMPEAGGLFDKSIYSKCLDIVAQRHEYADWHQIDMTEKEEWERNEFKASVIQEVAQEYADQQTAHLRKQVESLQSSLLDVSKKAVDLKQRNEKMERDIKTILPDLITAMESEYKSSAEGTAHEEFLKEDREILRKARELQQSLNKE